MQMIMYGRDCNSVREIFFSFVMILKTQLAQQIQHVEHEDNIVKKNAWLRDVFFFDLFIFLFYSTMRQIEQLKKNKPQK